MQTEHVATLCSQLAEILDAGAPTRLRVKQLKGIEQTVRTAPGLRADLQARLRVAIDSIEQYWAVLGQQPQARALDAVRYQAFTSLQALQARLRN